MNTLDYRLYYERTLPHYQPPGATLFLTYRLSGSLPATVIQRLLSESQQLQLKLRSILDANLRTAKADYYQRLLFGLWDNAIHTDSMGPRWLAAVEIATLLWDSILQRDGKVYSLHACCIMPNHVHMVFTPLLRTADEYYSLATIMASLKGYTAREANRLLGRKGQFWQHESYDRVVRDEDELMRILAYVIDNPVKAGLVKDANAWPWTYPRVVQTV